MKGMIAENEVFKKETRLVFAFLVQRRFRYVRTAILQITARSGLRTVHEALAPTLTQPILRAERRRPGVRAWPLEIFGLFATMQVIAVLPLESRRQAWQPIIALPKRLACIISAAAATSPAAARAIVASAGSLAIHSNSDLVAIG